MAIWDVFQVDSSLSSKIWLIVVPIYCCKEVFVHILHPFGHSIIATRFMVLKLLVVLKEALKLLKFIAHREFWISRVIVRGSKLRSQVNHVIETQHAHVVFLVQNGLDQLHLDMQHGNGVVSNELDAVLNQNDDRWKARVWIFVNL